MTHPEVPVGHEHYIGGDQAPAVIAEAGQCMEGSIDRAIEMAEAAANAGAWGFKVQLLTPDRIAAPFAPKYWDHGDTLDQRRTFERNGLIEYTDWRHVADACTDLGIEFIGTPFDEKACETLGAISNTIKIASGDITNIRLLHAARATGLPVILSTGASRISEIGWATQQLNEGHTILLACSLEYPTPPEHAALARIPRLAHNFPDIPIGYSDHTLGVWAAGVAAAVGAAVLEKHFSMGGSRLVPDHEMAVDADGLAAYVAGAERGWAAMRIGRLAPHPGEGAAGRGARRSWYALGDVGRGTVLSLGVAAPLRPVRSDAVPASEDLVGRVLCRDVRAGSPIRFGDLV